MHGRIEAGREIGRYRFSLHRELVWQSEFQIINNPCDNPTGGYDFHVYVIRLGEFVEKEKIRLQSEEEGQRAEALLWRWGSDKMEVFDDMYDALMGSAVLPQKQAAGLIGGYYVENVVYPGDNELQAVKMPERVLSLRDSVVERLEQLKDTHAVRLKLDSIRSLIRMGEVDDETVDELFRIATGEGRESWKYVTPVLTGEIKSGRKTKQEIDMHTQKDATGLLLSMRRNNLYIEEIDRCLRRILDSLETDSWLYHMYMNNATLREMDAQN